MVSILNLQLEQSLAGDWLASIPSPSFVEFDGSIEQDGLLGKSKDDGAFEVFVGVPSNGMEHQPMELDDPFSSSWLDTSTDILQFLTGEELEPTSCDPPKVEVTPAPADPTASALEILKTLAEENNEVLTAGGGDDAAARETECSDMGLPEGSLDLPEKDLQLLDMLAQSLEASPAYSEESVLSPITYDEVDELLSSGPCSPLSSTNSDSLASATAGVDSDDLGHVTVSGIDMTLDLYRLLTQVEAHSDVLSSDDSSGSTSDPDYTPIRRGKPYDRVKGRGRVDPEAKMLERKQRKKQQNKDAATRYRQKKRNESDVFQEECSQLESRNRELKDKVEQMTREIGYIKNLLSEVLEIKATS